MLREYKGMIVYQDGSYYIGYFSRGKPHGKGRKIFADLSIYEGDFVQGVQEGIGKFTQADGLKVYEGPFIQGKMEGKISVNVPGKEAYIVEMKNGEPIADNKAQENAVIEAFV